MIKTIIILFFSYRERPAIPKLATCPGQVQQITDIFYFVIYIYVGTYRNIIHVHTT